MSGLRISLNITKIADTNSFQGVSNDNNCDNKKNKRYVNSNLHNRFKKIKMISNQYIGAVCNIKTIIKSDSNQKSILYREKQFFSKITYFWRRAGRGPTFLIKSIYFFFLKMCNFKIYSK